MAYRRHEGSISHLTEKELSPLIPRFFHVLDDADVSHALRLPSSFAPRVEHLVDQEILLEDLCGQIWPVTLSYVDNALAFASGWKIFYRDHALEGGCSLIFNYVGDRQISVQIYDPSGCERTCFTYPVRQLNNHNYNHVGVEGISEIGSAPQTAAMGIPQRKGVFISDIHNDAINGKSYGKGKEPIIGKKWGSIHLDATPIMPPPGFSKPMGCISLERLDASRLVIPTEAELVSVKQEDPISPPPGFSKAMRGIFLERIDASRLVIPPEAELVPVKQEDPISPPPGFSRPMGGISQERMEGSRPVIPMEAELVPIKQETFVEGGMDDTVQERRFFKVYHRRKRI
ncbi:uncharacterized protein LOC127249840 isoform X2 [Andrographis paniculata]|uniref:uncharacterized protein LOC127249840 isoform X2 n=1 Tax=Andrographis paniculata TaxID=175694 RepID=UPI0021E8CBA6|nr:uncharacterized protein LOC127249840 isoform X2 [Andrographis paniculata]